ncbi:hypothetical protein PGTUg99_022525 [Puccinia graminis f. sp. tritici]|uniref:Uncharacterized protein n=1 Tax=Puccinia graminis f. sp. tritici TaxID=56615 RepID=A0A5B0RAD6_PUCGR|nr:hypothetical protein PGTUg99_022525 [Puccinia graminis f. sp. tritici]
MPSTFNLVNPVKRHVLFWSLTLTLVSSSVTPRRPVLARLQSKPPKLKVAPHSMHGFKGLSPRFEISEISTATNTHVPRPGEEIMNSDCCGGNAPDHRLSTPKNVIISDNPVLKDDIAQPKHSQVPIENGGSSIHRSTQGRTPDKELSTQESTIPVGRDEKPSSSRDPEDPSIRSDYSQIPVKSSDQDFQKNVLKHKQDTPYLPKVESPIVTFPLVSRTSYRKSKELPASHWLKVCQNRHRLKHLAQSPSSQVKAPSSVEEEITSFWVKLAKLKISAKEPKEQFSTKDLKSSLGREEKLKSVQNTDVGSSSFSTHSPSSERWPVKVSESILSDLKQKGPNSPQEVSLMELPGKDHSGNWSEKSPQVQGNLTSPSSIVPSKLLSLISRRQNERISSSESSPSREALDASGVVISKERQNARRQWRKAATNIRAVSAWGSLRDRAIHKADGFVQKVDYWIEKIKDIVDKIHEEWEQFDSLLEVLEMYLNSRDHHQLDPFGLRDW